MLPPPPQKKNTYRLKHLQSNRSAWYCCPYRRRAARRAAPGSWAPAVSRPAAGRRPPGFADASSARMWWRGSDPCSWARAEIPPPGICSPRKPATRRAWERETWENRTNYMMCEQNCDQRALRETQIKSHGMRHACLHARMGNGYILYSICNAAVQPTATAPRCAHNEWHRNVKPGGFKIRIYARYSLRTHSIPVAQTPHKSNWSSICINHTRMRRIWALRIALSAGTCLGRLRLALSICMFVMHGLLDGPDPWQSNGNPSDFRLSVLLQIHMC